jgi:hypothetical protein
VIEEPVFFLVLDGFQDHPEILYRSNFLGAVMYMDEPAARLLNQRELADATTPGEAAATITRVTRDRYEGSDRYGRRHLDRLLRDAGYDFGCEVLQGDYPVWEAVASSAWYEFEAGIPGWCYEGRFQPTKFAELIREHLGVEFPADPEACLAFHFAFFTGAARHFDRRWGISVYGQMDAQAADLAFPRAYDAGATYFWLWTSDRSHHVPFERQLELVRELRDYRERHPRHAGARDLTNGAEVAIALPWGYLGPEAWLPVPGGSQDGRLWGSDDLALDAKTAGGATYRKVLQQAVREAVRRWEENVRFDFVFLRPGEKATGYERVYRVLETAEIVEESGLRRF